MADKPSSSQLNSAKPSQTEANLDPSRSQDPGDLRRESFIAPPNLRRRRCNFTPTCGCILENTIYVCIVVGTLMDIACIAFWTSLLAWNPTDWNYHRARDTAVQTLVMHCFCILFNFLLFFGVSIENVLLCLCWVMMRGIWYFTALVNWIRSSDILRFDGKMTGPNKVMVTLDDKVKMVWKITFWGYGPLMAIYVYFTIIVVVFICRLITITERRRLNVRQVQGIVFTDVNPARLSVIPMPPTPEEQQSV